jgi:2-methylcitrate dehydratase PrpD
MTVDTSASEHQAGADIAEPVERTPLAAQLAAHALTTTPISPETTSQMRRFLQDFLAVTLGGTNRDSSIAARRSVTPADRRSPHHPAQIIGTTRWATREEAALVNGTTAHALELDDTHEQASLHPGVVIFPAVMAAAEGEDVTVDEVLAAATVGYDVMCAVGTLIGAGDSYARGFHPTGICGTIGAAAAVSRLWELDHNQATHAISIAAGYTAGSLEFLSDGSWTKRLNAGQAASSGIRAASLARTGFRAPALSVEGRDGFLRSYGTGEVPGRSLDLTLGQAAAETSIKLYPCCRYIHGNLDLLLDIVRDTPDLLERGIARVDVGVIKAGALLVSVPAASKLTVASTVDAQFNMPFSAALALTTGSATVEQFEHAPALAAGLLPLMEKVRCVDSDRLESAFPARWKAEVRVELDDGEVIERRSEGFRGSPVDPVTADDLVTKATGLVGADIADRIAACVEALTPAARWQLDVPVTALG